MTVKYYPATKGQRSSLIAKFLTQYKVKHELINLDESSLIKKRLFRGGEVPAVEVDGRLYIDPNEDALKKILDVE